MKRLIAIAALALTGCATYVSPNGSVVVEPAPPVVVVRPAPPVVYAPPPPVVYQWGFYYGRPYHLPPRRGYYYHCRGYGCW